MTLASYTLAVAQYMKRFHNMDIVAETYPGLSAAIAGIITDYNRRECTIAQCANRLSEIISDFERANG